MPATVEMHTYRDGESTPVVDLYPDGNDTAAETGTSATEATSRPGVYTYSNTSETGLHKIVLRTGSTVIADGWAVLDTNGAIVVSASRWEALRVQVTGSTGVTTGDVAASVTGAVGSVTGNVGGNVTGNVTGSVGSVVGAVGSVAGSVTVGTNNDKTGYSLAAGTGLGNQTADITGSLSGSVGSVTGNVGGNVGGNVTGSVGSVLGGINTTAGTIQTLDALDTAQDTQHGTTQTYLTNNLGAAGAAATEAGGTGDHLTALASASTTNGIASAIGSLYLLNATTIGSTGNSTTTIHIPGLTYADDEIIGQLLVIYDASSGERHARWIDDWAFATELATVEELPFTPAGGVDIVWISSITKASLDAQLADIPTVSEFEARTPSATAIANVETVFNADFANNYSTDNDGWRTYPAGYYDQGQASNQQFPNNFASLGINGSGHISRVTLVDTTTANTDMATALATAQSDLDILTGTDGVTLATLQPNYAPATATALTTVDTVVDGIKAVTDLLLITTGTVDNALADATTTVFKTNLLAVNDFFNDQRLQITSGALAGQSKPISDFVQINGVITLAEALTNAPENGVTFAILDDHTHAISQIQSGLATSTALQTVDDEVGAIATSINSGNVVVASVTGAVGSVTDPVTAGTVSDKTGYTLDSNQAFNNTGTLTGNIVGNVTGSVDSVTSGVALTSGERTTLAGVIWDTVTSGLTAVGSIGKLLVDNINATIGSRATQTSVDAIPTTIRVKKNSALAGFSFPIVDASDTLLTGLTVTATRTLDGGALGSTTNSVTEIGGGFYTINLSAADLNANNVALKFSATGAKDTIFVLVTQP